MLSKKKPNTTQQMLYDSISRENKSVGTETKEWDRRVNILGGSVREVLGVLVVHIILMW